jgi:hypothetical protein
MSATRSTCGTLRKKQCVLVAADWARPAIDVEQMRQLRFPLPGGNVKEEKEVAAATGAVRKDLAALVKGTSPSGSPRRVSASTKTTTSATWSPT